MTLSPSQEAGRGTRRSPPGADKCERPVLRAIQHFSCFPFQDRTTFRSASCKMSIDTVKMISAEGHEFIVDRKCATISGTIKSMLTGPGWILIIVVISSAYSFRNFLEQAISLNQPREKLRSLRSQQKSWRKSSSTCTTNFVTQTTRRTRSFLFSKLSPKLPSNSLWRQTS